jgi:LPS sulfotransferase NodH
VERLIICCTPRTGSNWLQGEIAKQPGRISGGEWYQRTEWRNQPDVWANKQRRPTLCNLIKIFAWDHREPTFDSVLGSGRIIYLYREDRAAQLASWRKACETGLWTPDSKPVPVPFPDDAEEQIELADQLFRPIAAECWSLEQIGSSVVAEVLKSVLL